MFRPNLRCTVTPYIGADAYGKKIYGPGKVVGVGVVKLERSSNKTSVRTDSSASRGSAQEILADARLLFLSHVILQPGDKIEILGFKLTVVSVFPRHAVTGRFDHWQVDCNVLFELNV